MSFSKSLAMAGSLAMVSLLASCKGSAPDDLIVGEQSTRMLVFVKATAEETLNRTRASSNLYVLSPISADGQVRALTNFANASIYDPCVSFDGKQVLFSMAPQSGARRNIYEMNIDGTNLRQVSGVDSQGRSGDDFDPLYLPDDRIAFTSNRPGYLDEYNRSRAEVLHVMNADGSDIQQISFNMSDDFDPFLLADGRIAYTRWDHHGTQNRFPLFATRPDGSGTFHLFGPHNRNFFHTAVVPDGRLVSILSTEVNGDAGRIALSTLAGTHEDPPSGTNISYITPDITMDGPPFDLGAYKYPRWVGDNKFVVSYSLPFGEEDAEGNMNEDDADYGLYTFEVVTDGAGNEIISNLTFLYNDPTTQEYDAQLVAPSARPPVLPSELDLSQDSGVFHVGSIFNRQSRDGQEIPQPGEVQDVMVVEAIPTMPGDSRDISSTEFERKRIIGTAPVEADGSFHIEVPANTPIAFLIRDNLGRSIVTKRNWIYARPGEQFLKCAGCHADRGTIGTLNTMAMGRGPTDLNVPVAQRQVINFQDVLEPVVAAKCSGCHVPTFEERIVNGVAVIDTMPAPGNLDLRMHEVTNMEMNETFPQAYFSLAGGMDDMMNSSVVRPGFSRRSRLIDVILGVGSAAGDLAHPQDVAALTDEEKSWFITWVDLGAQYR